jgi:hypothetical protein
MLRTSADPCSRRSGSCARSVDAPLTEGNGSVRWQTQVTVEHLNASCCSSLLGAVRCASADGLMTREGSCGDVQLARSRSPRWLWRSH